ncbi:MAG: choice-of-anchor Q domain-containing protein [Polyangiaceae bacterium]
MRRPTPFLVSLFALALGAPAYATDFHVDPATGSSAGDGSAAKPWKTLAEVIQANLVETQNWDSLPYAAGKTLKPKNAGAPIKAGDRILLHTGFHGSVSIIGHYNSAAITVEPAPGQAPQLSKLVVRSSSNWVIRGLEVNRELAPSYDTSTLVSVENHNHSGPVSDITIAGFTVHSVSDTSGWTATDWDTKSANGISLAGKNITIRGNLVEDVNFGISSSAQDSLIEKNTVDRFAGDGLRGLGDYTTFQYNLVKNCYDVNANHDDGFQSWSVGSDGKVGTGEVVGVTLRGNMIINYEDPNQPMRCTLQGIGMFDGMFRDWVVENNVIITDHWHGITLLGAINAQVINNTVLDLNTQSPGPPWIKLGNHKNGTPSTGIVRNNLTTAVANEGTGVTEEANVIIKDPTAHFVAPPYDVHLLQSSAAVDKGVATGAPGLDIEGIPRPQGSAIDVGAYEWHDSSVTPTGGPGAGGGTPGGSGGSSSGGSSGAAGSSGAGNGGSAGSAAGGNGGSGNSAGGGAASAGAAGTGASAAGAKSSDEDGGCGCRTAPARPAAPAWLLALVAAVALRRKQRRQ